MPIVLTEDEIHFANTVGGYDLQHEEERIRLRFEHARHVKENRREPIKPTAPQERIGMYLSWLLETANALERIEDQIPEDISREIFAIRNIHDRISRKLNAKETERKTTIPQFGAVRQPEEIPMTRPRSQRKLKLDTRD